jgi:hypothetical protein
MTVRLLLGLALLASSPAIAQTDSASAADLLEALESTPATVKSGHMPVIATFKGTRIVNGHSIENVGRGVLDFRILHRFNTVRNGVDDLFGLDGATTKLSFDYGITDAIMVGFGRSTLNKEVDGWTKIRLLRQTEDNHIPLSVSYAGAIGVQTAKVEVPEGATYYFSNRVAYTNQLLIARKFSEKFSLQLMPTVVHYNLVPTASDPNTIYALGVGGRAKLSRRISLTGEWYPVLGDRLGGTSDALSIGFDIETGGHVFQLHFTNSAGMSERSFIGQTQDSWGDGDIRFGFNISRVFTIVRPKGFSKGENKIY